MPNVFEDTDFDTVQVMYGFVLIARASIIGTALAGNVAALTAVVCLLLLKDGFPNFIIGVKKISARKANPDART